MSGTYTANGGIRKSWTSAFRLEKAMAGKLCRLLLCDMLRYSLSGADVAFPTLLAALAQFMQFAVLIQRLALTEKSSHELSENWLWDDSEKTDPSQIQR